MIEINGLPVLLVNNFYDENSNRRKELKSGRNNNEIMEYIHIF